MSVSIKSSDYELSDLEKFDRWLKAEWGEVDPIDSNEYPKPVLAFDKSLELVGGLSFTNAQHPEKDGECLWINTVFVSFENRGRGIAQELIQEAEIVAYSSEINELLVLTEWPRLYEKLGWEIIDDDQGVLRKYLGENA